MNQQNQSLFIGYETLEEWLKSADKTRPVFANLIIDPGKSKDTGIRTDRYVIIVNQPEEGGGLVHYCRLLVEKIRYVADQPFDQDRDLRVARARNAWSIVEDWLIENGFTVSHGIFATPKDFLLLDGWAGFLEFDQERQQYLRKKEKRHKTRIPKKPMI